MNIYTSYKAVTKWLQNKDKKNLFFLQKMLDILTGLCYTKGVADEENGKS